MEGQAGVTAHQDRSDQTQAIAEAAHVGQQIPIVVAGAVGDEKLAVEGNVDFDGYLVVLIFSLN